MPSADPIRIVDYQPRHAEAWRALNEAWIQRFFAIEAKDRRMLDDPGGEVLAKGGLIFMAEDDASPIGCVALLPMADGGLELAKMAVAEPAQGRGAGRLLMQACIAAGRARGAARLYIETNSGLPPALALYRSSGFVDLPPQAPPYSRCDVWMELRLG